jgi:hypothetical protein
MQVLRPTQGRSTCTNDYFPFFVTIENFTMKLHSIASAAALLCVASSSFALTPAQLDANTVQLWISGASAPTAAVFGAVRKLCVDANNDAKPDDLHVYLSSAPTVASDAFPGKSNAGKFAAYACTMGAAAGPSLAGKKTIVYHTFDIGSFEAYTPHLYLAGEPVTATNFVTASVKRLKDIKAAASTCALTALVTTDPTYLNCGNTAVTLATNTLNGSGLPVSLPTLPVGGLSDTEFTLNQINLGVTKSLSDIGSEVSTNVGQVFGMIVSYPLYKAMQVSQGLLATTGGACDVTPALAVGGAITTVNTTLACQPNMSRQKYASLVGGGAGDKDAGLFASSLAGSPLVVERRVGSSGTQSASNAFFLNAPCATGIALGAGTVDGSNTVGSTVYPATATTGGVTIRSNNGSGDVKTNITAASTAGTYAIGALSAENVPSATEKFAFIKLNGVSPAAGDANQRQTAIDGDYEFWYETAAFTATSASGAGVDLMAGLVSALGDPTVTNLRGLFVTPLSGNTNAAFPSQVSKGYKNGNSCAVSTQ